MASIYKRGDTWWIQFLVDGRRVRKSLDTDVERVAMDRKREIDAMCRLKLLRRPTATPFKPFLEAYCAHLKAICTPDGYQNDLSRLRGFFGPCIVALRLGSHVPKKYRREPQAEAEVTKDGGRSRLTIRTLEQLTSLSISNFLAERVAEGAIAGKPPTATAKFCSACSTTLSPSTATCVRIVSGSTRWKQCRGFRRASR